MPKRLDELLDPLPTDAMRIHFLWVGQGESTLVLVPHGGGHLSLLIDCNRAPKLKGIDIPNLLKTNLPEIKDDPDKRVKLDVFMNTHPHNDHLCGLEKIREVARVDEVWHSGHRPGPDHEGPYLELQSLIKEIRKRNGAEVQLKGSRSSTKFGQAEVWTLSPAEWIAEEIGDEKPEDRYRRIHDQCAVVRLRYKEVGVLITGDADKTAWKRITEYHGKPDANRMTSQVLSAPHHGSNTTFRDSDDDPEPYTSQIEAIDPEHVIVSAPDKDDSPHGHPDDYAMEQYEDAVGRDNVHHMQSQRCSFIVDIFADGTYTCYSDRGAIADEYPLEDEGKADDDDGGGGGGGGKKAAPEIISHVEKSRPMG